VRTRDKIASQASSYRQHARDTVQSAIELKPPISLDHLLRREKRISNTSKQGALPTAQPLWEEAGNTVVQETVQDQARWRLQVGPAEIAKVKETNVQREADLRESLKHIEDTAMSSIRELDSTYYAVLEKAATLRSTVSSLQRLAEESQRMNAEFRNESANLEQRTTRSLDSLDGYNAQERTINDLVAKLENAQSKRERLNQRLEDAQLRMEKFELRSKELSNARRSRWRVLWTVVVTLIVLSCAIVFARDGNTKGISNTEAAVTLVENIASPFQTATTSQTTQSRDPYLENLFDRL
jgi:hypothetical protein